MPTPTLPLIHDWNGSSLRLNAAVQDETLRDGVQGAETDPRIEDKRQLLARMVDLGVESANVGMPGAGVRAFEDAAALVREIVQWRWPITPTCAARTADADIDRIVDIGQDTGFAPEIATFIGSSSLRQSVEGWTLDHMLRSTAAAVSRGVRAGHEVMFVTEDTTRAHPDVLRALYGEAIRCGARRLCVCDTAGHATPTGVDRLIRFIQHEIIAPSGEPVALDWHGHRDRGLGVANALAAVHAGAQRIHATALGLGERAGNVEMEILLVNLAMAGVSQAGVSQAGVSQAGVSHRDLTHLPAYAAAASRAFGIAIPAHAPVVGANAFRTSAGVHASAIRKARISGGHPIADQVYAGVPASLVGRTQEVVVSASSGAANVRWWLDTHGYDATNDTLVYHILEEAKRRAHALSDIDLYGLVAEALVARTHLDHRPENFG